MISLSGITGRLSIPQRTFYQCNFQFTANYFYSSSNDYETLRQGDRVVSLGEKPFFDANSKSRRETLGLKV